MENINNKFVNSENKLKILENKLINSEILLEKQRKRIEVLENIFRCSQCQSINTLTNCFNCDKKICMNCCNSLETKNFTSDNIIIYFCKECK